MGRRPGAPTTRATSKQGGHPALGGDIQEEISVTVGNRRVRWALALATGSAVLTLTAACGGSGSGSSDNSNGGGTQAAGGQNPALAGYMDCLKQQGITLPTDRPSGRPSGRPSSRPSGVPSPGASGRPGGGGFAGMKPPGIDDATWQKAQQACASLRPTGGPGRGRPGGGQGANPAYANCLSDHGVPNGATPNPSNPNVTKALQACAALSPAPSAG
jgi:hypothetical protein